MINFFLVLLEMIICYFLMYLLIKKYKIEGLYYYAILITFISCLYTLKSISVLSISIPLGLSLSTSLIIGGHILTQYKGFEKIKDYIIIIITTSIISIVLIKLSCYMDMSNYAKATNIVYNQILDYNTRLYIANSLSIVLTIIISSKIYYNLKRIQNKIFISNIITITIVELLENIIFILVGYYNDWGSTEIILSITFRYFIKTIIGIIGTYPIYITTKYTE